MLHYPQGQRSEKPPDENTLSNVRSRIDVGAFVGVSFTFLDITEKIKKLFKLPDEG